MTPLPPVRKRADYRDIGKDDLVFALFHDRIAPPDALSDAGEPSTSDDTDTAADRRRWREKAIKAVKAGKPAAVRFASEAIPEDEQARIRAALASASSAAEVVEAFKAVEGTDALLSAEWDAAAQWAVDAMGEGNTT